jgi:hypothetical protein
LGLENLFTRNSKRRDTSVKVKTVAAGLESAEHDVVESEQTQPQLADAPTVEEIRRSL